MSTISLDDHWRLLFQKNVLPIDAICEMGHHIGVRADWEKSHLVINDATTINNPPCLCDVFKAFAYCGVTYFSFTSNGQR